jgi:hypothetical protein
VSTSRSIVAPRICIEASVVAPANWFNQTPSQTNTDCNSASQSHVAASLLAAYTPLLSDRASNCKAFCGTLLPKLSGRFADIAPQPHVQRCGRAAGSGIAWVAEIRNEPIRIVTPGLRRSQRSCAGLISRFKQKYHSSRHSHSSGNPEYRAGLMAGSTLWSSCQQCRSRSVETATIRKIGSGRRSRCDNCQAATLSLRSLRNSPETSPLF